MSDQALLVFPFGALCLERLFLVGFHKCVVLMWLFLRDSHQLYHSVLLLRVEVLVSETAQQGGVFPGKVWS